MNRAEHDWPFLTITLMGLWLLGSPATVGYAGPIVISDWAAGALLFVLGPFCVRLRSRWWTRWIAAVIGFWLLSAPLIFEVPEAAAYLNSTVIGTLVIAMALVIPRGLNGRQPREPDVPPGWSYNPSSWLQRTPIITLAFINFLLARYLAAYQLGHIEHAWDPVFDDGTHNVLKSDISESFPISDAGLGALAYMIEALVGCIGNASRWRTAPWAVAVFGVLVVPVGVVSLVLIMLQPLAVGDLCFICLVTALLMLLMAALAIPEVAAVTWFMWRTWRERRPFWKTFFSGGSVDGGTMQEPAVTLTSPMRNMLKEMFSGFTTPWNLLACAAIGAWLMLAPEIFDIDGNAATAHFVAGALVITMAALSMAEATRILRWSLLAIAAALSILVLTLGEIPAGIRMMSVVTAIALIGLCLPRGRLRQRHGAWQRLVR